MHGTTLDLVTKAIRAELHRQAETSGCHTDDDGRFMQVDGSFDAQLLAEAVLRAIANGSEHPDERERMTAGMAARALGKFAKQLRSDDPDAQRLRLAMWGVGKALSYDRQIPTVEETTAILELFIGELEQLPPRSP